MQRYECTHREKLAEFEEAIEEACHFTTAEQIKDNAVLTSLARILSHTNSLADSTRKCSTYSRLKRHSQQRHAATSWVFIIGLWGLQVSAFTGSTHIALEWLTITGL